MNNSGLHTNRLTLSPNRRFCPAETCLAKKRIGADRVETQRVCFRQRNGHQSGAAGDDLIDYEITGIWMAYRHCKAVPCIAGRKTALHADIDSAALLISRIHPGMELVALHGISTGRTLSNCGGPWLRPDAFILSVRLKTSPPPLTGLTC